MDKAQDLARGHWLQTQAGIDATLCSGFGQFHTNHPDAETRRPYVGIPLADVIGMVGEPQNVPKQRAQWCIPHNDLSEYGRDKSHLMGANGVQWFALWFDIDSGNHPIETITGAIQAICGNVQYAVYSSKGAKESARKWRGLIPLNEPVGGVVFEHAQARLNEELEARGITPDHSSASANQVFYLPNRGAFYQSAVNTDAGLLVGGDFAQPYTKRLHQEQQEAAEAQAARLAAFKARESTNPNRDAAYIEAVCVGKLQDAANRLMSAPDGGKHDALRKEAALIGGLLHFGAFSQEEASEVLIGAIAARCNSVSQARKTSAAAMRAGEQKPISAADILSKRKEKTAPAATEPETKPPAADKPKKPDGGAAMRAAAKSATKVSTEALDNAVARAVDGDIGAAFEADVKAALKALKAENEAQFWRYVSYFKDAGIPKGDLLKSIHHKDESVTENKQKLPPQSKLAAAMAAAINNRMVFNSVIEEWMLYGAGVWARMEKRAARRELAKDLPSEVGDLGYSASYFSGVCSLIEMALADENWQNRPELVPFSNGVLNLHNGELLRHSPAHRLTWQIPYEYQPHIDCPTIRNWLLEACGGDPDQVELLRAYLRAILVGAVGVQRYMELIGPGGTGKSTFIRLAEAMTGSHNVFSTEFKHLEQNRFETANIYGKRLVVITDSQGYAGDVSVLKAITGQDMLRFEEKKKQGGPGFKSAALVLIASNEPIASRDYTTGLSRRRITIHFKHRVQTWQRRDLDAEFAPELPGLVNWLLSMSNEVMRWYLLDTDSAVESLAGVTRQNLLDTNPLARWLDDCVIYDPEQQTGIGIKRESGGIFDGANEYLYPSYLQWCADNGLNSPLSNNRFSPLLEELCSEQLGLDVEKGKVTQGEQKGSKFFRGLVLNKDVDGFAVGGVSPIEYKYPTRTARDQQESRKTATSIPEIIF